MATKIEKVFERHDVIGVAGTISTHKTEGAAIAAATEAAAKVPGSSKDFVTVRSETYTRVQTSLS